MAIGSLEALPLPGRVAGGLRGMYLFFGCRLLSIVAGIARV